MRRLLAALLAGVCTFPAHALDIRPVSVSVPAGPAHAALWLDNPEPTAWTGQARLYRWTQQGDEEHLLPGTEVAVSPAHLAIPAGRRQRLRVVRLGAAPHDAQQGYRLILTPAPGAAPAQPRYSLPVFLEPATGTPPTSRLRVIAEGSPALPRLRLYNDGDAHAHLADLVFVDEQGRRQPLIDGLAGYVLPHSHRSWALPSRPDGYAGGRFRARLDHAAEAALPAAAPEIAAPAQAGL
ncbi:fimbrial biogenesis chaperone [Stenotrophomonas rhizophila]|uniref:Fimbrial chaperone protein n=1 Tax=Stenotrophomonas rhizophila TaxID=216778 RepID=A0AAW5PFW0_9GAMM|nr:fimbria/pilus periplasmic chaperone [Stenotrophomonas rhizophila]MCS4279394.1 fimbrial chaperone protein [Stenotrophomonas rhizophila]